MTARTRRTRELAKPRAGKFIFLGVFFITIALIGAFFIAGINMCLSWLQDLPDYTDADSYLLAEPTHVLDDRGNIIAEFYMENRSPISISEASPYVLRATIDIEDERFYSHNGVDYRGIIRAAVSTLTGGSQGASTITQQLVRNTVLKDEQFEHSLRRKVREAYIAIQLEKMFTKDEILMMYLNSIYYGAGCYGIEAAAELYFGKTCAELSLAEAATLAGLPQSPSLYDPTINPEYALERRNAVLYRMYVNGDISDEVYENTLAQPLVLNVTRRTSSGAYTYPYFVDYVKTRLNQQFSTDIIFKGGLTVKTSISPSIQQCAEDAVSSVIGLAWDDLEAALIAIDPHTGQIKAMVGGRDYYTDQFNLATMARRQPGSSFKTFTLVAAIQAGVNPNCLIDGSSPLVIDDWYCNNFEYVSYPNISLRQATYWSVNTVYAQVIHELGPQAVADVAHAMGITSELGLYDTLTLGSTGVSVLQMASAYATLAVGGLYIEPVAIVEVDDRNGNVLYKYEPLPQQVITSEVAAAVTDILQGVVLYGTGVEAQLTVNQPVAGKTGTTDNLRDLWFCGYTPELACAIWVGYRIEAPIYYLGAEGSTHTLPNVIFSRFMSTCLYGVPRMEFPYAGSPTYLSNSVWEFSRGTYVETTYTETVGDPDKQTEGTSGSGSQSGTGTRSGTSTR